MAPAQPQLLESSFKILVERCLPSKGTPTIKITEVNMAKDNAGSKPEDHQQLPPEEQSRDDSPYSRGYPALADFMSRNPDQTVFRKFSAMALLNILRLQAELQDMEHELHAIILEDSNSGNAVRKKYRLDFKHMRDFNTTEVEEEQSLQYDQIAEIGKTLEEYCEFLSSIFKNIHSRHDSPSHSGGHSIRAYAVSESKRSRHATPMVG